MSSAATLNLQPGTTAHGYFAHETAIIDPGARIGTGTRIWHWTHIGAGAEIGSNCSFGQNVYVGKARIGNNVKIQNNVSVYDGVVLEDDVFCGPSMVFTNVINPRSHVVRKHEYQQTIVKRGASIGANAVLICGHIVGRYAMIGAGAVVTKDVSDHALVLGNPARRVGWMCRCGVRLRQEASRRSTLYVVNPSKKSTRPFISLLQQQAVEPVLLTSLAKKLRLSKKPTAQRVNTTESRPLSERVTIQVRSAVREGFLVPVRAYAQCGACGSDYEIVRGSSCRVVE